MEGTEMAEGKEGNVARIGDCNFLEEDPENEFTPTNLRISTVCINMWNHSFYEDSKEDFNVEQIAKDYNLRFEFHKRQNLWKG